MNPPRRVYGPRPPGRLQATMLKVLAAELSDAGRLGRGKRYFNDGAVIDIDIAPGIVQAEVQGSRSEPYVASVVTSPGTGVPGRSDVRAVCDCPDADDPTRLCKHAVATMFALANEVAIEPELLDLWRSGQGESSPIDDADPPLATIIELFPGATENAGARSTSGDRRDRSDPHRPHRGDRNGFEDDSPSDGEIDDDGDEDDGDEAVEINAMLIAPNTAPGSPVEGLGDVNPIVHPSTGDRTVDRLISEMLDEIEIRW